MSFGDVPDLVGLPGIHIEVKRAEQVRLSEWMAQALRDSKRFRDGIPAVFHRRSHEVWHVTMSLSDFMTLYSAKSIIFRERRFQPMALTQNQQKAIAALLSSPSREDAARKCGLTSRTLRVYFQNDEFCDAYRAAFQELTENATRKAQQLLCPALETLEEVMQDADAPPAAKTNAARIVIDSTIKLTEVNDILTRIENLERARGEY